MAMEMDPEAGVRPLARTSSTIASATSLEWSSLSVTVKGKTVLQPTDGMLNSGDMLAVMGPSGCGKTTLLDAVSGRTRSHKLSGTVSFNGHTQVSFAQRSRVLSYVGQEDSLLGVFTVAESLRFAVRFYHGYGASAEETRALEEETLRLVGLESCRDTIVGDIFRKGLSGGQRRRGSLVELVMSRTRPRHFRDVPQAPPLAGGGAGQAARHPPPRRAHVRPRLGLRLWRDAAAQGDGARRARHCAHHPPAEQRALGPL